jgi:hypothetical protein
MMKALLVSFAFLTAGTVLTSAQERRGEERPAVVVPLPIPEVVAPGEERRDRRIETEGRGSSERKGCDSKTVNRETPGQSTTVTKERCD